MNQTYPSGQNEQYPSGFPNPPLKKSRKKLVVIVAAIVMVLLIIAASVMYYAASDKNGSAGGVSGENYVTLYYRDGKTMLWESSKGTDWLHEAHSGLAGIAIRELEKQFGDAALRRGEWRVTTTFDSSLQKTAEESMKQAETQMKRQKAQNAALIAEDVTTGQVVAVVDRMESATDDVVMQKVKVGTLALPLTYAAVMDNNPAVNASTTYDDSMGQLPGYPCTDRVVRRVGGNCLYNFDAKYLGRVSVGQALGGLRLVPAVKAALPLMEADTTKLRAYTEGLMSDGKVACYRDAQLKEEAPCYTSAVFGDGLFAAPKDIMQAYATLANGGKKLPQTTLLKATQNGKTRHEWRQQSGQQAMKAETAKTITDILSDPSVSSLPQVYKDRFSANGAKVSIVTGVDSGSTMGSMVQYSSKYAIGVWVVGAPQGIVGFTETAVLPPTTTWMRAAQ